MIVQFSSFSMLSWLAELDEVEHTEVFNGAI